MEGQIFTTHGSEMLNEIVVIFWVTVLATFITLILEWVFNVRDN
jgi:hypothetical protein